MTNQPTDDALVEAMARLMHDFEPDTLNGAWDSNDVPDWVRKIMRDCAAVLLPLVREAQAEALEEAADGMQVGTWPNGYAKAVLAVTHELRARAATYEGDAR